MRRIGRWLVEYPLFIGFLLLCVAVYLAGAYGPAEPNPNNPDTVFDVLHVVYVLLAVVNTGALFLHLRGGLGGANLFNYFMMGLPQAGAIAFIAENMRPANASLFALLWLVYNFAIGTFILLSEVLVGCRMGLSLTRRRKNWVKEIEYFYLLLGGTSIVAGMSKLPNVNYHMDWLNIAAPLVLTFAVVVRLIKTRAEIAGWNTVRFYKNKPWYLRWLWELRRLSKQKIDWHAYFLERSTIKQANRPPVTPMSVGPESNEAD